MANLSMLIDDEVMRRAELACDALGMTLPTAINIYLIKLGNEMRIPFEVSADSFYSPANQKVLEESIRQLEAGKGKQHELVEEDLEKQRVSKKLRVEMQKAEQSIATEGYYIF